MAQRYRFPLGNTFGVPYVKTVHVTDLNVGRFQIGQWVRTNNHVKSSRLVPNGHLVHPTGNGPKRVDNQTFRLACGKSLSAVLGTSYVDVTPTVERDFVLQFA